MKKFLIILSVIFIVSLGCKKENIGGGGLCACSPVINPPLSLVIKNSADVDLLNPKTKGYFDKTQIQLYSKDAKNMIKQINFEIRQPFAYTANLKIDYYQLISSEIPYLSKSIDQTFYLKLGDNKLYELNLKVTNNIVEKLLIDKTEAPKEIQTGTNSYLDTIYRLKIS
ncbi:hypothetical protein G7074_05210 [Pedobacter sp. HDW13]|uniref:hypothetical protein n=1 Tax=Pedobacter sp. HDW13 TaxID=2714940 RepID=UPI001409DD3B|nr:hypothetical protein [Pedobacter sp. HDW13]QIL38734.1 hypothetical protein G7074_05210 [Pedobacter sp. HDW13]